MKQTTREFIRRHAEMVSVALFVSVAVLAALVAALIPGDQARCAGRLRCVVCGICGLLHLG